VTSFQLVTTLGVADRFDADFEGSIWNGCGDFVSRIAAADQKCGLWLNAFKHEPYVLGVGLHACAINCANYVAFLSVEALTDEYFDSQSKQVCYRQGSKGELWTRIPAQLIICRIRSAGCINQIDEDGGASGAQADLCVFRAFAFLEEEAFDAEAGTPAVFVGEEMLTGCEGASQL
jgi:hypothetical protein